MTIIYFFLLESIMVHKYLGCLADDDGSYSKGRIGALLIGLIFFGFFIWLIVLSVQIGNKEHNTVLPPSTTTTTGMKIFCFHSKYEIRLNKIVSIALILQQAIYYF